jgi:hypothetical protein
MTAQAQAHRIAHLEEQSVARRRFQSRPSIQASGR